MISRRVGRLVQYMQFCTLEFQKRGLPHIHCLIWLADGGSEFSRSTIDVGAMQTTMRQGESSMRAITILLPADTPQSTRNNVHDQTQDKRLVATADAAVIPLQRYKKEIQRKGLVHPLARKLLKSSLLVKKLQMALVAVTVVQPPLIRIVQARMHEQ